MISCGAQWKTSHNTYCQCPASSVLTAIFVCPKPTWTHWNLLICWKLTVLEEKVVSFGFTKSVWFGFWSRLLSPWLPSPLSFVLWSQYSQNFHIDWLSVILLAEILRWSLFSWTWLWFGGLSSGTEPSKVTIIFVHHQRVSYNCKLPAVMCVWTHKTPCLALAIFLDWHIILCWCHPNRSLHTGYSIS